MRYERLDTGTAQTHTNYVYAGDKLIALRKTDSTGGKVQRYLHHDHLGSIETVTDATGAVVERLSYDPHGKRRNANWTDAASPIVQTQTTQRGFTGHEHLDGIELVHMTNA